MLKPSEALKPKSLEIASPVTDHFYMRATYFQPTVDDRAAPRLDERREPDGTLLSAEDDLGLDDVINQGRVEFDVRMGERSHMRVDYFKLSRFRQQVLPRADRLRRFHVRRRHDLPHHARLARVRDDVHVFFLPRRALRGRASDSACTSSRRSVGPASPARSNRESEGGSRHLPDHRGERRVPNHEALLGHGARPVVLRESRRIRRNDVRVPRRPAVPLAQELRVRHRLHADGDASSK